MFGFFRNNSLRYHPRDNWIKLGDIYMIDADSIEKDYEKKLLKFVFAEYNGQGYWLSRYCLYYQPSLKGKISLLESVFFSLVDGEHYRHQKGDPSEMLEYEPGSPIDQIYQEFLPEYGSVDVRTEKNRVQAEQDNPIKTYDFEERLSNIVGLENVKAEIHRIYATILADQKRRALGIPVNTNHALHMIFQGNPGTGKTTIARIISSIYSSLGVLPSDALTEVAAKDLISEYIGKTPQKTAEVFERAIGGVLFIDEAYSLMPSPNSFGGEALETLLKLMEDHRGEIVVILAGYPAEMQRLLSTNPGLTSRFPLQIDFPDYTVDELMEIAKGMYAKQYRILSPEAESRLCEVLQAAKQQDYFGNAREARNIVERSIRHQNERLINMTMGNFTKEQAMMIEASDF